MLTLPVKTRSPSFITVSGSQADQKLFSTKSFHLDYIFTLYFWLKHYISQTLSLNLFYEQWEVSKIWGPDCHASIFGSPRPKFGSPESLISRLPIMQALCNSYELSITCVIERHSIYDNFGICLEITIVILVNTPSPILWEKTWPNATLNGFRTVNILYICPHFVSRTSFLGLVKCSALGHLLE